MHILAELLDALEWAQIALRDVPDSDGINRSVISEQIAITLAKAEHLTR